MSARYRVQQFLLAAGTWLPGWLRPARGRVPSPAESDALVRRVLPPEAVALFARMSRYDRRHALGVAHTLQARGHSDASLLGAALLHDLGKSGSGPDRLRLWHRVAVVLLKPFPALLARLARGGPGESAPRSRWRRPFFRQIHHARLGAGLARQAGCAEEVADLIRRHEDRPCPAHETLLAALQAADDLN